MLGLRACSLRQKMGQGSFWSRADWLFGGTHKLPVTFSSDPQAPKRGCQLLHSEAGHLGQNQKAGGVSSEPEAEGPWPYFFCEVAEKRAKWKQELLSCVMTQAETPRILELSTFHSPWASSSSLFPQLLGRSALVRHPAPHEGSCSRLGGSTVLS